MRKTITNAVSEQSGNLKEDVSCKQTMYSGTEREGHILSGRGTITNSAPGQFGHPHDMVNVSGRPG